MKKIFFGLFILLLFDVAMAQTTGDFKRSILTTSTELNGDSLDIYFHIPANFDFGQPAKMIVGQHGLGNPDNSMQIRDYLSPAGDSIQAIVMCPDPYLQDQPKSRAALNEALDSVLSWYDIDENGIYIAGYSAGSDVAAQYVFNDPEHEMRGLIWHSPGFFANPDMNNQANFPPVCLCYGTSDFTSLLQATTLDNTFSSSAVPYLYNEIPGVGHTMEYPGLTSELLECIDFIDANTSVGWQEKQISRLLIYPNPLRSHQSLHISGLKEKADILIADISGKLVYSTTVRPDNDKVKLNNIAEILGAGIYYFRVRTRDRERMSLLLVH